MVSFNPGPRPKYEHPSNVLYYYGDDDCPIAQGDFGTALSYLIKAAAYEAGYAQEYGLETKDVNDTRNIFTLLKVHAEEALGAWKQFNGTANNAETWAEATPYFVATMREMADYDEHHGNKARAENFRSFADAAESGDYKSLAF